MRFLHINWILPLIVSTGVNSAVFKLNFTANDAAQPIDATFLGFSVEYFEGAQGLVASRGLNQKAIQLIHNLNYITGRPVEVRVGGHSADLVQYRPEQIQQLLQNLRDGADKLVEMARKEGIINPFNFKWTPVKYVIDVSFANPSDMQSISSWMKQSVDYLSNVPPKLEFPFFSNFFTKRFFFTRNYLEGFELGNEPEFYRGNERPLTYGPDLFRTEYGNAVRQLTDQHSFLRDFQNGAFQCGTVTPFWLKHYDRFLQEFGQHCYSFSLHDYTIGRKSAAEKDFGTYDLLNADIGRFFDDLKPKVTTARTLMKGNSFRIGEGNSVNAGGIAGLSDTFASALWGVRYMLEAAAIGVSGVNFHGGGGLDYSPIQWKVTNKNLSQPMLNSQGKPIPTPTPDDSERQYRARGVYFSLWFMAELMGREQMTVSQVARDFDGHWAIFVAKKTNCNFNVVIVRHTIPISFRQSNRNLRIFSNGVQGALQEDPATNGNSSTTTGTSNNVIRNIDLQLSSSKLKLQLPDGIPPSRFDVRAKYMVAPTLEMKINITFAGQFIDPVTGVIQGQKQYVLVDGDPVAGYDVKVPDNAATVVEFKCSF